MTEHFNTLLELALKEDLGKEGDISSGAVFDDQTDVYYLVAKQPGILCGKDQFSAVFEKIDPECTVDFKYDDGDELKNGDVAAVVKGKVLSILTAERTGLNFLCHLSGIATKTKQFVKAAGNSKVKILDTRKTLPAYRELEKYAVACGGGTNHRMGLYDMVMLKDNHIDAAGGITGAVEKVRSKWGSQYKIEVETRTLEEVEEAVRCGVDRIMLDNMSNELMSKAVALIDGKAESEASGNMSLERIAEVAATGVDFISFGELTHTVKTFDFSLRKKA